MYTTIITITFFLLVLLETIAIAVIDDLMKVEKLSRYILYKKIARSLVTIEFTVFNFLFSFARPEYVFQLLLQIASNIIALAYFILDHFYFSQRIRTYLLWLQNKVFISASINEAFEVIDANGVEFKEKRKLPQQAFSLVNAGNDKGTCIYLPTKKGGWLLKPINQMDDDTLMFYAQKIEIDIELDEDFKLGYYDGNLPIEAIKEYDFGSESKVYVWFRDKLFSQKGKTILVFILLGLFFAFVLVYIIAKEAFNFDILLEWFVAPL